MLDKPVEKLANDVSKVAEKVLRVSCEFESDATTLGQASAYLNLLATMLVEVDQDADE